MAKLIATIATSEFALDAGQEFSYHQVVLMFRGILFRQANDYDGADSVTFDDLGPGEYAVRAVSMDKEGRPMTDWVTSDPIIVPDPAPATPGEAPAAATARVVTSITVAFG